MVRVCAWADAVARGWCYSALDRLITCCGDDQPWFTLPTAHLQTLHDVQAFDLVLLDLMVPEHSRAGLRAEPVS